MSRFEDQPRPLPEEAFLKEALRREEPPAGFAARVMARIAAEPEPETLGERVARWFRVPALARAGLAAVLCLTAVVGVQFERQRQERERGEMAKRQLLLALRVTGTQLRAVHDKVREAGIGDSAAQ